MPDDLDPNESVTVTRAQLAQLQAANSFLGELTRDTSDAGKAVRAKAKEKWPAVRFPDDVATAYAEPLRAEIGEVKGTVTKLLERFETEAESRRDAAAESELRTALTAARGQYKFTDDGMQQVIDRMKSKNNPDVEAAAAWVAAQQPKPEALAPTGFGPAALHLFGAGADSDDAEVKALHTDPVKWFDKETASILGEFARGEHAA